jgi:putative hydrolase of the HAD superfamily
VTPIKAIFFDIGNVLVKLRTQAFLDGAAAACDPSWDQASIKAAFWKPEGPHIDYEKGQIDGPAFHAQMVERFGLRLDYRAWLQLWNAYFEPNRPMEALLARLQGQARFFTLSNTNAEHLAALKLNFRLLDRFEKVIASHEEGSRKPEPAFFHAALAKAGVAPGEALYLDDVEAFTEVGKSLGWQTFHYTFNDDALRQRLLELGFELPSLDGRSTAAC